MNIRAVFTANPVLYILCRDAAPCVSRVAFFEASSLHPLSHSPDRNTAMWRVDSRAEDRDRRASGVSATRATAHAVNVRTYVLTDVFMHVCTHVRTDGLTDARGFLSCSMSPVVTFCNRRPHLAKRLREAASHEIGGVLHHLPYSLKRYSKMFDG